MRDQNASDKWLSVFIFLQKELFMRLGAEFHRLVKKANVQSSLRSSTSTAAGRRLYRLLSRKPLSLGSLTLRAKSSHKGPNVPLANAHSRLTVPDDRVLARTGADPGGGVAH